MMLYRNFTLLIDISAAIFVDLFSLLKTRLLNLELFTAIGGLYAVNVFKTAF